MRTKSKYGWGVLAVAFVMLALGAASIAQYLCGFAGALFVVDMIELYKEDKKK